MKQQDKVDSYPIPKTCVHCGAEVIYTDNSTVYGKSYGNGKCYLCTGCKAYVGVHTGTIIPLGMLSTPDMLRMKKACHSVFDPTWNTFENRGKARGFAYRELAKMMRIPEKECHIGWFDLPKLKMAYACMKKPEWAAVKEKIAVEQVEWARLSANYKHKQSKRNGEEKIGD